MKLVGLGCAVRCAFQFVLGSRIIDVFKFLGPLSGSIRFSGAVVLEVLFCSPPPTVTLPSLTMVTFN